MFTWFERDGDFLRVEVLQLAEDRFELRVIQPDGTVSVETFSNAEDLAKRQGHLHSAITREGWNGPHGWVI